MLLLMGLSRFYSRGVFLFKISLLFGITRNLNYLYTSVLILVVLYIYSVLLVTHILYISILDGWSKKGKKGYFSTT